MNLTMKGMALVFALMAIASAQANDSDSFDIKYHTITKVEVTEIGEDFVRLPLRQSLNNKKLSHYAQGTEVVDPVEKVSKIISVSRDLVALGEDIYKLVIKGKPSNRTSYTPISIIPKVDGAPVDILDTENWKSPVKRTYEINYKNAYNIVVVHFRYSVIYSHGGSYDGRGAYLTSIQIVPETVRTLFGFDFTATMKLGGIQNQGTKHSPIAGATLLMEYTISSVMVAQNQVDSFFIGGNGEFKKL